MSEEIIEQMQKKIQDLFFEKRALEQTLEENINIILNLRKFIFVLDQSIKEMQSKVDYEKKFENS